MVLIVAMVLGVTEYIDNKSGFGDSRIRDWSSDAQHNTGNLFLNI